MDERGFVGGGGLMNTAPRCVLSAAALFALRSLCAGGALATRRADPGLAAAGRHVGRPPRGRAPPRGLAGRRQMGARPYGTRQGGAESITTDRAVSCPAPGRFCARRTHTPHPDPASQALGFPPISWTHHVAQPTLHLSGSSDGLLALSLTIVL